MVRPILTGCGTVSPFGGGVDAFWDGLCAGRSAIAPLRGFTVAGLDGVLAAEVPAGAVGPCLLAPPPRLHHHAPSPAGGGAPGHRGHRPNPGHPGGGGGGLRHIPRAAPGGRPPPPPPP